MTDREHKTSTIFGILADPASGRVLLLDGDAGWALPAAQVVDEPRLSPELATRELRGAFGTPAIAIRFARITKDEARHDIEGIFVFDAVAPIADQAETGRWVSRDDLAILPLANPDHRDVIHEVFRELETKDWPPFRQPWERPGWYAEATAWIEQSLGSLGREIAAPPVPVQWWSLSAVMRVGTGGGDCYFKAATQDQPLFCNEPSVTAWLGQRFPGRVPVVVASDPGKGWMLLENAGPEVGFDVPLERKAEVYRAFGNLQRETAGEIDALLATGCVDRRPERLIPQVERLLDDDAALAAVSGEDRDELRRLLPLAADLCRRLAEVPLTLIHGDIHLGNVTSRDGAFIFFDWTDASVAHPFVDMFMIYDEKDETTRDRLRDAYLSAWTEFAPIERLRTLWADAEPIHALHHAVSYHAILTHTEERAKGVVERAVPAYLGIALRALRAMAAPA